MKSLFTIILVSLLFVSCGLQSIPTANNAVEATWAEVQNQYKRRADLIPNLVETVKGYAGHEKDTLEGVVSARAKATAINVDAKDLNPETMKKFEAAQGELSQALGRLMVVSERYPDLKANVNFQGLQAQLEGTENRITVARRDFIEAVKNYNIELRTMPGKLVAAIAHPDAKIKETFKASEAEQEAPKVKF
jgi:LemA protein